ncbi:MAG: RsmE family RNA methyltransferase [Gemmatimonadaceae bacterium]
MADARDREGLALFFVPDETLAEGASVTLGEGLMHHVRVLRLGVGTTVALLNGRGQRAHGTFVRLSRSAGTVEVDSSAEFPPPPPVHLLVPIADRDRMLWLAEKCAELGATSWRPVLYKRSRYVKPRGEGPTFNGKLRARMGSALEQSGGAWLPAMYPDATLSRAIGALPAAGVRLVLDPAGDPILESAFEAPVIIAIGPEGGIDNEERDELIAAGFIPVSMGGNILRFETAAVAGLAIARSALHQREPAHGH